MLQGPIDLVPPLHGPSDRFQLPIAPSAGLVVLPGQLSQRAAPHAAEQAAALPFLPWLPPPNDHLALQVTAEPRLALQQGWEPKHKYDVVYVKSSLLY